MAICINECDMRQPTRVKLRHCMSLTSRVARDFKPWITYNNPKL